jgi:3-oxoacyl-[acyl-carrier-protein] synthase III
MRTNVGIVAIGMHMPGDVRRNDWWPADLVARWTEQRLAAPSRALPAQLTEGSKRVLHAMAELADDPFQGAVERRVLAPDVTVLDMEEQAARAAIARSGIDPAEIDLLLTHSVVPDYQMANPASFLHHRLGMSKTCLSMYTEATAYSVFGQLALAEAMIAVGRAKYALLVQSSVATRLIDKEDPGSVLVGDGATALVLGPVSAGRGLLSAAHYTEGRYPESLIMSVRNGRWFDDGRVRLHVGDWQQMYEAFLRAADMCKEGVDAALAKSGHRISDIDFLCVSQGNAWLSRVVHEHIGVREVNPIDTFSRFGYLSTVMLPAALYVAEQEGRLADGDLVALTGGGTGMTYGGMMLRWGR